MTLNQDLLLGRAGENPCGDYARPQARMARYKFPCAICFTA
jgi:hypothetical protein